MCFIGQVTQQHCPAAKFSQHSFAASVNMGLEDEMVSRSLEDDIDGGGGGDDDDDSFIHSFIKFL